MSFKALFYAYVLGGVTFLPLLLCAALAWTLYTSVPVNDENSLKATKVSKDKDKESGVLGEEQEETTPPIYTNDQPRPRKAWLTVRRTFEEKGPDISVMNVMRSLSFLDPRPKDPKKLRPKDMWYVVLKGNVLYLYEDETMTECEAAIQVSSHKVVIYPEGLQDGELFTKRNAICLKPINPRSEEMISVTKEMKLEKSDIERELDEMDAEGGKGQKEKNRLEEVERLKDEARSQAFDFSTPWFIFIKSCFEMEDWYFALVHAANYSSSNSTLEPVQPVFLASDMDLLVSTLDDQPDVIPVRWLNALIGRIFFSFYRTQTLESFIIGRLMKKLSKVKIPSFLQNVSVTKASVGNTPPTFSKPMLKELTKEGDAAMEIRVVYRGEVRIIAEATAILTLAQRTYTVKLVLAVVLRKLDGNLLVKVKRPPTNRIWYAFTQPPEMVLDVEPVVSDRQIKWSMILSPLESRLKEIINESIVLPNLDDIAFFESSSYEHRGGIWADAARRERTVSEMSNSTQPQKDKSTTETNTLQKAQSSDILPTTIVTSDEKESPDHKFARAESFSTSISAPDMTDSPKRKSWFGSSRNLGHGSLNVSNGELGADSLSIKEEERGRSSNAEETAGRRATSVPAKKSTATDGPEDKDGDKADDPNQQAFSVDGEKSESTPTLLSPGNISRLRSMSSGANMSSSAPSNSTLSTEIQDVPTSRSNAQSPSLLSALKAKDKQALSNSAKEAMRKWSANWSAFKRDHIGNHVNAEDSVDGNPQDNDALFTFPSKGRNYADIRAAVANRKDENRISSSLERPGESASMPIDIPRRTRQDDDIADHSRSRSSSASRDQDVAMSSSSQASPRGPSLLRKDSKRSAPSPPELTTETHSTDTSRQQGARPILVSSSPPIQAPPIKTQPSQAAGMTIPGIHASHRGEVMSMGYVAPSPTSTPGTDTRSRTTSIQPTIQSMYKLFRSPTATGGFLQRQTDSPSKLSGSNSPEPVPQQLPITECVVESSSSAPGQATEQNETSALKLAPPPLPPRLLPNASSSPPPMPPRRNANSQTLTQASDPNNRVTASASDVLKLIAEQDEVKRRSLDSPAWNSELKQDLEVDHAGPSVKHSVIDATRVVEDSHEDVGSGQEPPHGPGEAAQASSRQEVDQPLTSQASEVIAQRDEQCITNLDDLQPGCDSTMRANSQGESPRNESPSAPQRPPPPPLPPRKQPTPTPI